MGYVDAEIKRLQSIVDSLDDRLKALEAREFGGNSLHKKSTEEIRMLLIGPPGAGTLLSPEATTIMMECVREMLMGS